MNGKETCVEFLQWALPRLGLTWPGFRRVHRQVCKRIGRRLQTLRLSDAREYRAYLESHPDEWAVLDSFCRISVSRLARDRIVFQGLARTVLPELAADAQARGARELRCWSAGCASGEEPYTLRIFWRLELAPRFPDLVLTIVATDIDAALLERARVARYRRSSLREVPAAWIDAAFTRSEDWFALRPEFRTGVELRHEDIREQIPGGLFDLILCRNLVFTYFDAPSQRRTLDRMLAALRPGGALVIGFKERLPEGTTGLVAWARELGIFRKSPDLELALVLARPNSTALGRRGAG
ncbi:MAG TPA: CheR family methyltransferase [Gemmatimonadales bacterium]|nr:CheR family methyltransferase [Gemmatimonadales bacterium]